MLFDLSREIEKRKVEGLYRVRRCIDSVRGSTAQINGRSFTNFSSNDYLGLSGHPELKEGLIRAIDEYGLGAASSPLITGYWKVHAELEKKLAAFLNRDAALVFSSGYQANLAASVLIDTNTVVLQDRLNHSSLIDAALLSQGKLVRYSHNDPEHLKTLMEKYKNKNLLVMTDAVFSMDGDYARLKEIAALCGTYKARLMVDDAHGIGVLGKAGGGLLAELGLSQEDVPVLTGTFGKAFGLTGAFVAGSKTVIDAFIQKAKTYIYTTALMPGIAATLILVLELVSTADDLRTRLRSLAGDYRKKIQSAGLTQTPAPFHIQPLIIGEVGEAARVAQALFEKKIVVAAIKPPTVPVGTARLRIGLTAEHSEQQLDNLVCALKETGCLI